MRRLWFANVSRFLGRIAGLGILGYLLTQIFSHGVFLNTPDLKDIGAWLCIFLYMEGLVLAWAWELAGSIIAFATAFGFYLLLSSFLSRPSYFPWWFYSSGAPVLFHLLSVFLRSPGPEEEAKAAPEPTGFPLKIAVIAATLAVAVCFGINFRARWQPFGVSKLHANESSAIASLKTLVTAEEQYMATSGTPVYGTLWELSGTAPPYVDAILGRGKKSGYSFVLTVGTPAGSRWFATARPTVPAKTGNRYFFADSSGIIRFSRSRPASSADSPLD